MTGTTETEAWPSRRRYGFYFLALLLGTFLAAASAPSPLYRLYQAAWNFSSGTLTAIYGVYAFGALAGLLVTGRLSDHVGRRLVTILGLLIQLLSMLAFVVAQGVEWLFVARVLQGVGTGIAAGAISAWLLDLQPTDRPRLGSLVAGVALVAGLGLGGLGAAALIDFARDPLHLVFWVLSAFFVVGLLAMPLVPDVVAREAGWFGSLRPQVGVPASARSTFLAVLPSLVAIWAVGGLYLALGPSLAVALLGSDSRIAGGAVIAALLVTAAVASFGGRNADPRLALVAGSLVLTVGVVVALLAVAGGSLVGLLVGSVISGLGFGPAFSGVLRTLTPLSPPNQRGALLAAIYIAIYLAFSVPTIVAGVVAGAIGLQETTYAYGLIIVALALTTAVAVSRRRDRSPAG